MKLKDSITPFQLDRGRVIEIDTVNTMVGHDYQVYMQLSSSNSPEFIPIGKIPTSNLVYFPQYTELPLPSQITKIIYLGNYNFSVKHLNKITDEFALLNEYDKASVLEKTGAMAESPITSEDLD